MREDRRLPDKPILSVRDLTVCYKTDGQLLPALEGVSFDVGRGSALGLVGESGSGKSTAALCIVGLLEINAVVQSGGILFEGDQILSLPDSERRRLRGSRISIVFQDPFTSLNPALKVGFQIAEPLIEHQGFTRRQAEATALELMADMRIDRPHRVANAYPHQLSGGMMQRVVIASAFACEPSLIILDEPTTARRSSLSWKTFGIAERSVSST